MLIRALETCGRRGRVLLPLGLLAGFGLPWAAQPVRHLIPLCIFVLLTLAMLRLLSVRSKPVSQNHELGSSDTSLVDQPLMLDNSDTSLVDQTLMIDSSVSRVVEQRHRFPGPATKKIDRHHNVSWFSARVVDQEQKRVASVPGTLDSDQAGFFAGVFFTSVQTIRTGFSAFKATRPDILGWVVVSQCLLPLGLFLLGLSLQLDNAWLLPLILVATASPIAGSPSLVAMLGGDDSRTLRWLLIGSALLPCTAMPVFYLLFQQTDPWQLIKPSLLLLCLTGGALVLAVILHSALQRTKRQVSTLAIDGGSSTALAVMVIGLMSPLHDPGQTLQMFLRTLALACAVNFGLQLAGYFLGRLWRQKPDAVIGTAVVFGNRNIALFLAALPGSISNDLLLFIACYQIPMYLTPVLGRLLGQVLGRIAWRSTDI